MSASSTKMPDWLAPVEATLARPEPPAALLVLCDAYRPDLMQALAHFCHLRFFDFRANEMVPLGQAAARLPLSSLDQAIEAALAAAVAESQSGVLIHNAEALLATKSAEERARWLASVVARPGPHLVVIPITLFPGDAPSPSDHVVRIDATTLPQETLLFRLAAR